MSRTKTIAVDFDLVMYPSDVGWIDWLNRVSGKNYTFPYKEGDKKYNYNTAEHYKDFEKLTGVNPFQYWNDPYLYDQLRPIEGSVEVLKKLKESGNNIVVVSHCKGDHLSSKARAIKLRYPFIELKNPQSRDGFVATKEKSVVHADVMIDDRYYNLKAFPDETIKLYFNTKWEDEEFDKGSVDLVTSVSNPWGDIEEFLTDLGFIK